MKRDLPDGRLVVVPSTAHVVDYSAPAALVAATRESLVEAAEAGWGDRAAGA